MLKIICKSREGKEKYLIVEMVKIEGKAPFVEKIEVLETKKVRIRPYVQIRVCSVPNF